MPSPRKVVAIKLSLFTLCTILLAALFVFFLVHRSFSHAALKTGLEEAISGNAEIGTFHSRYFPPGCVAEGVSLRQGSQPGPPLIVVAKLSIRSTLAGLISGRRVSMRADGMRVSVPASGSREPIKLSSHSNVRIIEFTAENSVLEIGRSDKQPLRFLVHELKLHNIATGSRLLFNVRLTNPEPPGEISASGEFGRWNARDFGKTPLGGEYQFQRADLGVFKGIRGELFSRGRFTGILERIGVRGDTDTPDFQVKSSMHAVDLRTRFQALVDAKNGDTQLQEVQSHFWNTTVQSQGSVARRAGQKGKEAVIHMASSAGRIQDLLRLFIKSPRAPMDGVVSFRATATIPPGKTPFLKKVTLTGDFGIDEGNFKPRTQEKVNKLSAGARGEKGEEKDGADLQTVLTNLKGHVALSNGIAKFSHLSFTMPGASAQLDGSYNVITEKIDLHGVLRTDAELANTVHGPKALFLKVLDRFFKKKHAGYIAPVKITGTYDHPSFGLDLSGKHQHHASGE